MYLNPHWPTLKKRVSLLSIKGTGFTVLQSLSLEVRTPEKISDFGRDRFLPHLYQFIIRQLLYTEGYKKYVFTIDIGRGIWKHCSNVISRDFSQRIGSVSLVEYWQKLFCDNTNGKEIRSWGFQEAESHQGGKPVSPTHRLIRPEGHSAPGRIMSKKKIPMAPSGISFKTVLPQVESVKYLGLHFDRKLN